MFQCGKHIFFNIKTGQTVQDCPYRDYQLGPLCYFPTAHKYLTHDICYIAYTAAKGRQ